MRGESWKAYLYLLPAAVLFLVFTAYPISRSIQLSTMDYELIRPEHAKFVGLDNFKEALSLYGDPKKDDKKIPLTLGNTLRYVMLFLPGYVLLPIPIAFLIDRLRRGQVFFRVLTFLPIVVSGAVISVLWVTIYHPTYGPLAGPIAGWDSFLDGVRDWFRGQGWQWCESLVGYLYLPKAGLLADPTSAMPSLAAMAIWHGFGFNVLLYLVALANIPGELYEAAEVDGATRAQVFRRVTLPLLRPGIYLVSVLGLIGSLKVFGPMFIMTGGGPQNTTVSVVMYIYQTAFTFGNLRMGYAAAMALLLAVVILFFAVTASKLNRPVDR